MAKTKICLFLLSFLLIGSLSYGQLGAGKLAGKITDAETGEPLIGANIVILNTQMGAATDINGEYFILNITPGTYNVKVSFVGYSSKTIQNIRVVTGITYELNTNLSSGIDLDEIVVTDKKFFEEKATNTVKVVDADQIAKMPVKGITKVASLQSGVVAAEGSGGADGNANINVRGGRSSEVLYIIDGVPQNNVMNNQSEAQVSDFAIDQMSFQVGGYEAKYGQAQSGIINITTKAGSPKYNLFADLVTSSFTDDYGYNLYTGSLSGPIIPGNGNHTFFVSAERGWFLDNNPSAVDLKFETLNKSYNYRPNTSSGVWRFTARTNHDFGNIRFNLGANVNLRNARGYIHSYVKNNSQMFPEFDQNNYSLSARMSHTISNSTFWNLNVGYRKFYTEEYNPVFKDDIFKYGDKEALYNELGVVVASNGLRIQKDAEGVFWKYGRVNNVYSKDENDIISGDFNLTSQYENHLIELGGGFQYNTIRSLYINPASLAFMVKDQGYSKTEAIANSQPTIFGYDLNLNKTNSGDGEFAPKNPILGYFYIQDRFEEDDIVLNLGLRVDYFDTQEDVLKNPSKPFLGGDDPTKFDKNDFTAKDVEVEFSPRIGLGFPVTESTVFHAQYGRFIQQPALEDLYNGPYDIITFETMDPQYVRTGSISSEETIQYEIGLRQVIGGNTALNVTAFYKTIKGLVNRQLRFFQRTDGGAKYTYIAPQNSDFGTTKGMALSLDITKLSYFNVSAQYTYSIAEGTGSSTNSSQTAVFRNQDNEAPKVIAPLDFDQRHTAIFNINFYVPKGELGLLEQLNANILLSYNSGRPYTPLDYFDILTGNDGGPSTTGYMNSRYMSGSFRMDLKIDKVFNIGNLSLTPYVWIENVFDADNVVNVYQSTGDPYTTGYLKTDQGKAIIEARGEGYENDYKALERDPGNFGIPRQIKLGLRVNFGNITF